MIAIICHDAGGAEILSSWVSVTNKPVCVAVDGPAKVIFARKCPEYKIITVDEAIAKAEWVLTGSGWETTFERDALVKANDKNKKTVVFLDHWVNYSSRHTLNERIVLPDEFWVGDSEAFRIAKDCFPESDVKLVTNPYFEELKKEFNNFIKVSEKKFGLTVLYVTEPIVDHAAKLGSDAADWNYSEHDALSFFINNIDALGAPVEKIVIRPHPAESKDKYNWAINSLKNISIDEREKSLVDAINNVDVVVGCETMAMVVGLLAEKRIVSSIPPNGKNCSLPFNKIEYLRDIAGTKYDANKTS